VCRELASELGAGFSGGTHSLTVDLAPAQPRTPAWYRWALRPTMAWTLVPAW
jgi:hypothetical protein